MRIRKRKVPLPLSLLSPVPLSDPHLFSQSPVHHPPQPSVHSASDLRRPLIVVGNGYSATATAFTSSGAKEEDQQQEQLEKPCLGFQERGGVGERILLHSSGNNNDDDDDASKEDEEFVPAEENNNHGPPAGVSLPNEIGATRWSERERVIPLKKRRSSGSFFEQPPPPQDEKEEGKAGVNGGLSTEHKKGGGGGSKQKRGTTIMEGSRCSRVNGRGWRCFQPTLVGYSLCEHHLGKGRLRSMTSVRGRPSSASKKHHHQRAATVVKDNNDKQHHQQNNNKRVKYKLAVVKARSLSSLLGQTPNTPTTPATAASTTSNVDGISSSICNAEGDNQVVVN